MREAFFLLLLVFFAAACARTPEVPSGEPKEGPTQLITASYYGEKHAGLLTANGEVFDPNALTAAHRRYPFGTILKVTNPKNGKSVRVRINDRGPYVNGRSLDLSQRAAREIGMEQVGVSLVKVEVLKLGAVP
jgi:rare lipoprotein A